MRPRPDTQSSNFERTGPARKSWANHVGWDEEYHPLHDSRYKELPQVKKLEELIRKSLIVPAWLADINSPQYAYTNRVEHLRDGALVLPDTLSDLKYTKIPDDHKLSAHVDQCLPTILHIVSQTDHLGHKDPQLGAMEADRRYPMHMLGSLVWNFQSDELVTYRTERRLQIPRPTKRGTHVQPDACAFIPISHIPRVPSMMMPGLSCLSPNKSSSPNYDYILHWVTEFKRHANATNSRYQVVQGLVSALYQRRAFGFPNHLVFGTAHHSRTSLEVLAATWVPSEPANNPGTCSMQEANSEAVGQANVPSASESRGAEATGGESQTNEGAGRTTLTIEDIKRHKKIVVFTVAEFSMNDDSSVLELYLFMRQTWHLARNYQNDIKEHSPILIRELAKQAEDIYKWPPPPPRTSDRGSKRQRTGSEPDSRMSTVTEEGGEEDMMSVDQDDDSDSASDPQDPDSPNDSGPTCRISGEVAKYTLINYAYEEDTGAREAGDPPISQPSVSQIARV